MQRRARSLGGKTNSPEIECK